MAARHGVSLREIAERAQVSLATVSNVVNGYRPVSEATRRRVQQAVDELGYTPNLAARHLRHGRSGVIALTVPELENPYFAELAATVVEQAHRHGYTVVLDYTGGDRETELNRLAGLADRIVDGMIFSPVRLNRDDVLGRSSRMPLVLIGESVYDVPFDHIAIDNVAASHVAVEHLVALGRRRIAFVGAHPDHTRAPAHLRLRGYLDALAAAGLPVVPELIAATAQFGRPDGFAAMRRLLDGTPEPGNQTRPDGTPEPGDPKARPDAVFAYNDLVAIGALHAIRLAGLRVPDDIAVIGFDDIEDGRFSNPTLTTISPDKQHLGRLAVGQLIARIEGRPVQPLGDVQPPFRLVVRESSQTRLAGGERAAESGTPQHGPARPG